MHDKNLLAMGSFTLAIGNYLVFIYNVVVEKTVHTNTCLFLKACHDISASACGSDIYMYHFFFWLGVPANLRKFRLDPCVFVFDVKYWDSCTNHCTEKLKMSRKSKQWARIRTPIVLPSYLTWAKPDMGTRYKSWEPSLPLGPTSSSQYRFLDY